MLDPQENLLKLNKHFQCLTCLHQDVSHFASDHSQAGIKLLSVMYSGHSWSCGLDFYKKKKTQHQILLFYWLHQLFSLLELVEEHQVEIETIKADYEEQQSEMKVGECCPGTYFSFSEFFFLCRKLFPSWHGPPFYKMGSNLNKIFLLFCFCIIFLVVGLK